MVRATKNAARNYPTPPNVTGSIHVKYFITAGANSWAPLLSTVSPGHPKNVNKMHQLEEIECISSCY